MSWSREDENQLNGSSVSVDVYMREREEISIVDALSFLPECLKIRII